MLRSNEWIDEGEGKGRGKGRGMERGMGNRMEYTSSVHADTDSLR